MSDISEKHLDFLQSIITRMNSNSFNIKGWCIGITSALLALCASTKIATIIIILPIPIVSFWLLDAFYLQQERKYRNLYTCVISGEHEIQKYDLNAERDFIKCEPYNSYLSSCFSTTLKLFYGLSCIITFLVGISIMLIPGNRPPKQSIEVTTELKSPILVTATITNPVSEHSPCCPRPESKR